MANKPRIGIPLANLILPHFCACPRPGPAFLRSYVLVCCMLNDLICCERWLFVLLTLVELSTITVQISFHNTYFSVSSFISPLDIALFFGLWRFSEIKYFWWLKNILIYKLKKKKYVCSLKVLSVQNLKKFSVFRFSEHDLKKIQ